MGNVDRQLLDAWLRDSWMGCHTSMTTRSASNTQGAHECNNESLRQVIYSVALSRPCGDRLHRASCTNQSGPNFASKIQTKTLTASHNRAQIFHAYLASQLVVGIIDLAQAPFPSSTGTANSHKRLQAWHPCCQHPAACMLPHSRLML